MIKMWKIFIFYLFIQLINGNYSDPIYPVQNPCLAILDRLSDMSAAFLNCAVSRARPFKLCEGCVDNFARLQDLIGLLDKTFSDIDKKITCKQFLESYDSIQIVAQLISFVQNIWSSSFCDICNVLTEKEKNDTYYEYIIYRSYYSISRKRRFIIESIKMCTFKKFVSKIAFFCCITHYNDINGTVDYSLTDNTIKFTQKKMNFDMCIFNATGRMVPIIPIDLNVTLNTNVCTVCLATYNDINDFFLQMTQETKHGVCMDIVDTMNYTRLLWSKIYECRRHDPDYMAVFGVSFFIPTLVFVFYVSALFKGKNFIFVEVYVKNYEIFFFDLGERKQKKLSRQKRLSPHSTNAALVGTRTWLWSNPNA
uniref:Osteopetrosis associated transmembrane protein n=1 Tax=Macrotrachela sp. HR TaxID=1659204 RepID=A0A0G3VYN4_9BILA|nr:osteopetrosis associated transmembrane protein [Macrotrachela sp. HR]